MYNYLLLNYTLCNQPIIVHASQPFFSFWLFHRNGTWISVSIWLAIGVLVYLFYGRHHSCLADAIYVPTAHADEIYRTSSECLSQLRKQQFPSSLRQGKLHFSFTILIHVYFGFLVREKKLEQRKEIESGIQILDTIEAAYQFGIHVSIQQKSMHRKSSGVKIYFLYSP